MIIPKKVNKPDRQLEVDDIAGTRTKVNKFVSTRNTDPLNPQYQLPNVVIMPAPEPKFIRDNMQIDVHCFLYRISKGLEPNKLMC